MSHHSLDRRTRSGAIALLVVFGLLTAAVFLPKALGVPFDFTVAKLFVQDGSDQDDLDGVMRRFVRDDQDAIAVLTAVEGDWFSPKRLDALHRLHRTIEAVPVEAEDELLWTQNGCGDGPQTGRAFDRVRSLSNAQVFRRSELGLQLTEFRAKEGFGPTERNRQELMEHPLLRGRQISDDGSSTIVTARIRCGLHDDRVRRRYLATLRGIVTDFATKHPWVEAAATGIPFIQNDIIATMRSEMVTRQPIVAIGMVVFLWLAFRRFRYAMLPFLSVGLASIWWLGTLTLMGEGINIINFSTITVILVIGVGDCIHLVARMEEELEAGREAWAALKSAWRAMLPAITLTTATTVIGFGSLAVARVHLVRSYGLWAAYGITLCWLFTLTVVPALLLLFPPKMEAKRANEELFLNRRILPAISRIALGYPRTVVGLSVLAMGASIFLSRDIIPHSRALEEVRHDHQAQVALNLLEEKFVGAMAFDLVIEGPRDQVLAPQNLRRIAAFQSELDDQPAGVKSLSLVDLLGGLHSLWSKNQPGGRDSLPERQDQIEALLAMLTLDGDELLRPYVSDPAAAAAAPEPPQAEDVPLGEDEFGIVDESDASPEPVVAQAPKLAPDRVIALRIRSLKRDSGSSLFAATADWIDASIEAWPAGQTMTFTGNSKLANRAVLATIGDMISSLGLAFVLISFMFMAVLRSVQQGLMAMVPNLMPLLVTLAYMAVTGLNLRISTVIIFAMCMGVVVDDTIHFLVRLQQERKELDYEEAIDATVRHAGRPVVFTSMMLVMGFTLLIPSNFNGLRDFGVLSSICISLALVADLTTLPSMLMLTRKRGA